MSKKEKLGEAQKKSAERRMEKAEEFADKLVDNLGEKVKCVAVYGSVPKGEHTHESDIDTFVVLDDTKLEKDVPKEAKNKIRKKVTDLANETDDRITIQYFSFLTDFWDSIRKGEPLVIQVLRIGEPVYDVGVFMPAKRMLERGKIKSTDEAVKKRLKLAAAGYKKAEKEVRSSIPHKLEQAIANAGQAPIMLTGRAPPGKEDVGDVLEEMFVEDDGPLEAEFVEIAHDIDEFSDKAEKHPDEVDIEELDEMMDRTDDFIRRMHKLAGEVGGQKKAKGIVDEYKTFLKANVASLKSQGIEPPEDKEDLPDIVIENTDFGDDHRELFDRWETVMEKVKDKSLDDLDDKEVQGLRSDTREFVSQVGKDIKEMKEDEGPDMDMPSDSIAKSAKQGLNVKDYEKNKKQAEPDTDAEDDSK
jgi:predicted nucleotidyltransferase